MYQPVALFIGLPLCAGVPADFGRFVSGFPYRRTCTGVMALVLTVVGDERF